MHKKLRKLKSLLGAILFCSGAGKNARTSSLALALEVSPHCSANTVSPFLSDNSWELGSAAGPVIQANRRLSFEDDLRSGGLLYCVLQCPH